MDCNKSSPCDTSFDCVVTELPNIFELDGKIIDDIHAIYKSKRCGSKNKNRKGRKWSPSAACLIASLMTKVPEHFVQQVVKHLEENDASVPCYTYFKNKADFVKMFVNEERVEMEKYFKSLNETQKRSWHYDEINHRKELIQELDIKVR